MCSAGRQRRRKLKRRGQYHWQDQHWQHPALPNGYPKPLIHRVSRRVPETSCNGLHPPKERLLTTNCSIFEVRPKFKLSSSVDAMLGLNNINAVVDLNYDL